MERERQMSIQSEWTIKRFQSFGPFFLDHDCGPIFAWKLICSQISFLLIASQYIYFSLLTFQFQIIQFDRFSLLFAFFSFFQYIHDEYSFFFFRLQLCSLFQMFNSIISYSSSFMSKLDHSEERFCCKIWPQFMLPTEFCVCVYTLSRRRSFESILNHTHNQEKYESRCYR